MVDVGLEGLLRGFELGDLGDRNVPPRLGAGGIQQRVGFDVDDDRAAVFGGGLGVADGLLELGDDLLARFDPDHLHAEAFGVQGQVHREPVAVVEAVVLLVQGPVLGAEALRAEGLGERADRGVAVVLDQDHDQLDPLGDGGDEFGVHHQVGAVPHHHDDVALRPALRGFGQGGALDAEAAGDFVAHAGVGVFDVVAERVPDAPHLVQVTREGPGGADDDVLGVHGAARGADDLVLRRQRGEAGVEGLVHRGVPARLLVRDLLLEVRADPVAAEGLVQLDQGLAGVGDDRQGGAVLVGVDRRRR